MIFSLYTFLAEVVAFLLLIYGFNIYLVPTLRSVLEERKKRMQLAIADIESADHKVIRAENKAKHILKEIGKQCSIAKARLSKENKSRQQRMKTEIALMREQSIDKLNKDILLKRIDMEKTLSLSVKKSIEDFTVEFLGKTLTEEDHNVIVNQILKNIEL